MISNYVGIDAGILDLAAKYGDHLSKSDLGALGSQSFEAYQHANTGMLKWNNPENLDSGVSGIVLFLIELYKQTKEAKYLEIIDNSISHLVAYCKNNPTNNYSLYTGRGSVVYVLMQRYFTNGDRSLLKKSIELIKPANQEYLQSKYTSDYLYDGRSGTLLLLLHLYLLTREEFLAEYINQFTEKIIGNANLSSNGVYWTSKDEINLGPSCGFAYGAAGIRYVLNELNHYSQNAALDFVIAEADKFIASCWQPKMQNWPDFRKDVLGKDTLKKYKKAYLSGDKTLFAPNDDVCWANGSIGVMFALSGNIESKKVEQLNDKLAELVGNGEIAPNSLFGGLAGLGLYLLDTRGDVNDNELQKIIFRILNKLTPASHKINMQGGLLHGELGSMYFLLKAIGIEDKSENILFPFFNNKANDKLVALTLNIDLPRVRKTLLSKIYTRSVFMLENLAPAALNAHFASGVSNVNEIVRFIYFIKHQLPQQTSAAVYERLKDLFQLETSKYEFTYAERETPLQLFLDDLLYQERILVDLNREGEWLKQQSLTVAGKLKSVHTKWDWSYLDHFEPMRNRNTHEKLLKNMEQAPAQYEYIFQYSGKYGVVEVFLVKALNLVLHRFDQPKTVGQAMMEINYYIKSLPEPAMDAFLKDVGAFKSSTTADFLVKLDKMVLDQVRPLIYRNMLSIAG